jgi:anthranilate phosphoribosyltransferase
MVLINSAAALYTAGVDISLKNCVAIAGETIDTGKAMQKLSEFAAASNEN